MPTGGPRKGSRSVAAIGRRSAQAEASPRGELVARIGPREVVVAAHKHADEREEREEAEHGREDHRRVVGDCLLEPRARETEDLERVVRRVQTTCHVEHTGTDIVFSTPYERRPLMILPAADDTAKSGGPPGA